MPDGRNPQPHFMRIGNLKHSLNGKAMTKKETTKFIVQIIVSIASAILTALGATSCMGYQQRESLWFSRPGGFLFHLPKCKDNNSFSITKTKTYNYSCKKNFSYIPCSIQKQILLLHLDSIFVSKSQQRCSQCNFYITIPVVMTTKVLSYNTVIMTV